MTYIAEDQREVRTSLPLNQKTRGYLGSTSGERMISERFTLSGFQRTMARCKLYDYKDHTWLDFAGRPTTGGTISGARFGTVAAPAGSEPKGPDRRW